MNVAGYSSTRFSTTSGDIIGAEQLKAVSPVAWIHVNFYGRYSFSEEPLDVPIYGFVETMAKCSFRTEISTSEETIDRSVIVKRTSVRYKFSGRAGLNPSLGARGPTHRNRVMRRRCPVCSITEMTGSQAVWMRAGLLNCQPFSQSPKGFTLRERV